MLKEIPLIRSRGKDGMSKELGRGRNLTSVATSREKVVEDISKKSLIPKGIDASPLPLLKV